MRPLSSTTALLSTRHVLRTLTISLAMGVAGANAQSQADEQNEESINPFVNAVLDKRSTLDGKPYSPYVDADYPQQLLWGDTHLHSSQSIDANSAGNETLGPDAAYRFARGEVITASSGQPVRLSRPLDFLVVSDHAEYLGILPRLRSGDSALLQYEKGQDYLQRMAGGPENAAQLFAMLGQAFMNSDAQYAVPELSFDSWKANSATADQYYQPGRFTTLIGYEWTYFPQGDNLHRVVVYKDGADKAASMPPFSSLDGQTPEELWAFMAEYEAKTGGEIMAIPHNANVSNGRMFALRDSAGKPFTEAYSRQRQRWEPIVEVTQIKGDAETHPYLSPDDEFADFETWDKGNLNVMEAVAKKPAMLQYEYARSALKLGLTEAARGGVNPFKFGMIGSTDAHTSLATGAEENFWGKASMIEPGFARLADPFIPRVPGENTIMAWGMVASGYAAVWAKENTREGVFDAMRRKEVYATTGTRIGLRLFGGWTLNEALLAKPNRVQLAYQQAVPMGGDLPKPVKAAAPSFMVLAAKDPMGANLDRVQIIKGWLDTGGRLYEKVYNVAVSSERTLREDGSVAPVQSTVDLETVSFANSVGNGHLEVVWQDPDFNPNHRAFYYARVLEIPTPRWSEYDRARFGFEVPEDAPREVQDRAYSSPIWYTP